VLFSYFILFVFFFSSRRRHTRSKRDWSSDVCSSDLVPSSGFNTDGTGTFKPLEGTDPFIGEQDSIAYVNETKIETVVKEADLQRSEERRVGKESRYRRSA